MEIIIDIPTKFNINFEQFKQFLRSNEWNRIDRNLVHIEAYEYKRNVKMQIILPTTETLLDSSYITAAAIKTVALIHDETIQSIIKLIQDA